VQTFHTITALFFYWLAWAGFIYMNLAPTYIKYPKLYSAIIASSTVLCIGLASSDLPHARGMGVVTSLALFAALICTLNKPLHKLASGLVTCSSAPDTERRPR
jgi:hypothetical protein